MTTTKKFSKFELFVLVYKTMDLKIQNHTMDDIFESVDAQPEGDTHQLFIHFKERSYCFSLDTDRIYEVYQNTNYDLVATVRTLIELAKKQYDEIENISSASNETKDIMDIRNIYVQVLPYNEEYFSDKLQIPLDFDNNLRILFRCYVGHGPNGIVSIPVTKEIFNLHFTQYSINEFLEIAKNNTKRLFPLKITRISYAMEIALAQNGYTNKEIQDYIARCSKHNFLYMVKTDANLYGPNVFLFPEILKEFAQKIGSSYFILPGGQREVYFASEKNSLKDDWLDTIKGANKISPDEFLSDHLYYYDHKTGQVSIYK